MYTKDEILKKCFHVHGDKYDYSSVGDNIHMNSKVPIGCPEHGIFYQILKKHISGQGCPECGKNNKNKKSKVNGYTQFISTSNERFKGKYSYPKIEEEYNGSHSTITIKCNDCGSIFTKKVCDHITSQNGGCKVCLTNTKKTWYTYDNLLLLSNKKINVKPFEGKVCKNDFVTCTCEKHGDYQVFVSTLLNNRGFCKKCAKSNSRDTINDLISILNKKIEETYGCKYTVNYDNVTSLSSKVTLTCNDCGYTFGRSVKTILENGFIDCNRCIGRRNAVKRRRTTKEYVSISKRIYGDLYDYSETVYEASDKKVKIKCNRCGRIFEIEANSHLMGHGCPYHYTNKSIDEENILNYIKSIYQGKVYNNDRTLLGDGLELDVVIPEKNLAIEYDGLYWHNELNKPNDYHLSKTLECEQKGYRLIHIFEDEWKNPMKQDIWKSMLTNMLGLNVRRIYARKCTLSKINGHEASVFLENNHIQGKCSSSVYYGLFYKGELVSVMTFGPSRHFIGNGKSEYELLRFCNKKYTTVVGGASKLFKAFLNDYNPKSIVSYADRRWSDGNLYNKLGFTKYNTSKPNYYYVIGVTRKNRFNFRKSILVKKYNCPQETSERDFCFKQKWYRIYDCGCLCYIINNKMDC